MAEPLQWEQIKVERRFYGTTVLRAPVFGGWLVSTQISDGNGLTFIPDPNHEWEVQTQAQ